MAPGEPEKTGTVDVVVSLLLGRGCPGGAVGETPLKAELGLRGTTGVSYRAEIRGTTPTDLLASRSLAARQSSTLGRRPQEVTSKEMLTSFYDTQLVDTSRA